MACTSLSMATSPVPTAAAATDGHKEQNSLSRTLSGENLCRRARIRRSYSDHHSLNRVLASIPQPNFTNSRSIGRFNLKSLSGSILPNSLRSFLFDPATSKEMEMVTDRSSETEKRSSWVEKLVEIRSHWRERQEKDNAEDGGDFEDDGEDDGSGCEVEYGDEEKEGRMEDVDSESFSRLLSRVRWSEAKRFSQLASLCNMAYVIAEIEAEDLRRYYGLHFVTSSLEKKSRAAALKAKLDQDSTCVLVASLAPAASDPPDKSRRSEEKRPNCPAVVYEIAASAASYVHSCTNDRKEEAVSSSPRVYKSEVAAYVAASTMTAVVAADEKEKQEAAKELQSLHSSPCEWFICDDPSTYTRQFVIQGSDSLASWQANLFFEPTKFEGTDVLVHRGIYEAAKGIYEQFMPEIKEHMNRQGERAKLQFTGHSLGGSLSLLVNLMLLTRKAVKPSALRPVVTFGSPFVFCGGQKILDELRLDEDHIHCVIMHRDIVPRAFACNYPNHVAQVLKRLSGSFLSHPCLTKKKLLYSPMGKIFILQPDEKSSPPHPLLPPGSALYALENTKRGFTQTALGAFLNSPHPLETLSNPKAYGSEGTILRDHDSSNYLKAVNGVIRQHTQTIVKRVKKQRKFLWPLLTLQTSHSWSQKHTLEDNRLVNKEVMTSV
ncbi:hypothetical protein U1Q18_023704 [Sarracenia purpurea var. burkii]